MSIIGGSTVYTDSHIIEAVTVLCHKSLVRGQPSPSSFLFSTKPAISAAHHATMTIQLRKTETAQNITHSEAHKSSAVTKEEGGER